jgi:hypothetical protein
VGILIKHDGCHLWITAENKWMGVVDLFLKMLIGWLCFVQASNVGLKLRYATIALLLKI